MAISESKQLELDSLKNRIAEAYQKETSARRLAEILDEPEWRILHFMGHLGLKPLGKHNRKFRPEMRKYKPIFQHLTDAQLGYICGLMASDGCLEPKGYQVNFSQTESDIATVELVSSSIVKPKAPIKILSGAVGFGGKDMARTSICSKAFWKYLSQLGLTPNKSKSLYVKLDDKSEEFLWYFLRGVIDGDGSVYVSDKHSCCISVGSASKQFLEIIQTKFGGKINSQNKEDTFWSIRFNGAKAYELANLLPKDDYTMQRKTEKLLELVARIKK